MFQRRPPNPNLNVFMRHDPAHDGSGYAICDLLCLGLIAVFIGALAALQFA